MLRVVALALVASSVGCGHSCPVESGPVERCIGWKPDRGECTRTLEIIDDPDPLLVRARLELRWIGLPSDRPTHPVSHTWTVPRSKLDAVLDSFPERMTCERVVPIARNLAPGACLPRVELPRIPDVRRTLDERARVCPGSQNPNVIDLDSTALATVFRPRYGSWQRVGESGAGATYESRDRQVRITISDMIHECTGEEATDLLLETEQYVHPGFLATQRMLSATSAVLLVQLTNVGPTRKRLVMWIAGRCRITVEQLEHGLYPEQMAAVGHAIDLAKLEPLCAARAQR